MSTEGAKRLGEWARAVRTSAQVDRLVNRWRWQEGKLDIDRKILGDFDRHLKAQGRNRSDASLEEFEEWLWSEYELAVSEPIAEEFVEWLSTTYGYDGQVQILLNRWSKLENGKFLKPPVDMLALMELSGLFQLPDDNAPGKTRGATMRDFFEIHLGRLLPPTIGCIPNCSHRDRESRRG